MGEAAVTLQGVTKRFAEVVAVDDVDLIVENGEFFSLLGPSGCGKTTTLRMIGGLEFPTRGSISIFGEEMALRPPDERPVNTVFQSYALFPHMTVAENVAFGLEMRRIPRSEITGKVADVLELVRLSGMESRHPAQLSGGQQQRVALARALVNEPKVLLLDEPLGALDLKLRKAMQLELKALQERVGITFIYVTHDQEEALTMSDRIGVMSEGRLLQVGTPEEIYERPTARFVADFIGETSFLPATVEGEGKVRLSDGTVLRADTGLPPGTEVTLALRPEKTGIHSPSRYEQANGPVEDPELGEVNALAGRIAEAVYVGTSRFYDVEVGPGRLRVRQENRRDREPFSAGDAVVVVWEPAAAQVLED